MILADKQECADVICWFTTRYSGCVHQPHQVGSGSQKGTAGCPNKQWCEIVITVYGGNCYYDKRNNNIKNYTGNLLAIVRCIGLNRKLQCAVCWKSSKSVEKRSLVK